MAIRLRDSGFETDPAASFYETSELTDFILRCSENKGFQNLRVHRSVLTRCAYFKACFRVGMKEEQYALTEC